MQPLTSKKSDKIILNNGEVNKQLENIRLKETNSKWRIQNNSSYQPYPLNIGQVNNNISKDERNIKDLKHLRQRKGQMSPIADKLNSNHQTVNSQIKEEELNQSLKLISHKYNIKDNTLAQKHQHQKEIRKMRMTEPQFKSMDFSQNTRLMTEQTYNQTFTVQPNEIPIKTQQKRMKPQNKAFSLIDLKNELIQNGNNQNQVNEQLKNADLLNNQVVYNIQNEIESKKTNNYDQQQSSYLSNDNQLRQSSFSFTVANKFKKSNESLINDKKYKLKQNLSQFSKSPENTKSTTKTFPLNRLNSDQSSHLNKEKSEQDIFNKQMSIPSKMKTTPKVSISDLDSVNLCTIRSNYQELLSESDCLQHQRVKSLTSSLKIPYQHIMTEGNIKLNRKNSLNSKIRRLGSNQTEIEDWEFSKGSQLTESINQYHNKGGSQYKQQKILKQQEQLLSQIERTKSVSRTNIKFDSKRNSQHSNSNYNLVSEKNINLFSKIDCLQYNGNTCPIIPLKNEEGRVKTEVSPLTRTNIQFKNVRNYSPMTTTNGNIWVSTDLPFQNNFYETLPHNKKHEVPNNNKNNNKDQTPHNDSPSVISTKTLLKHQKSYNQTSTSFNPNNMPFNKTQLSITGTLFSKTNQSSKQQNTQMQPEDYPDEVIGDNQQSPQAKYQEDQLSFSSTYSSQLFKNANFNQSQFSQKSLRITLTDRYKNSSRFNFEKQITDRKLENDLQNQKKPLFQEAKEFQLGRNNKIVTNENKDKFRQFLKLQDIPTLGNQFPKDTPISQIMPSLKLHEMKYQSKAPILDDGNQNLQQLFKDGLLNSDHEKNNNINIYEESYYINQLKNQMQDQAAYNEYKEISRINDFEERKPDGWFKKWEDKQNIKQEQILKRIKIQQIQDKTEETNNALTIQEAIRKRRIQILFSLQSQLLKFIKLNLTLKEVYQNGLFGKGVVRPLSSEFFEAVKQDNAKEFNLLIKEDKYLVYSTDNQQQTALHWAAKRGLLKVLVKLINLKSDVEARDSIQIQNTQLKFGRTPLYYAYRESHLEAAVLLMKNKACPWSDKQNDISKYANHPNNFSIHKSYRLAKKIHLMLTISSPKQRIQLWQEFKFSIDKMR